MASKMASIDPAVAEILDRTTRPGNDSEDEDDLISALEEEDDKSMAAFREQRLQQLHGEFSRAKEMRNSEYGTYTEIKEEKQVMDITTGAKLCVVHFMKPDFTRCRVMDEKLEVRVIPGVGPFSKAHADFVFVFPPVQLLAPKHFDTRFISVNVENAPFLVTRLKIQVLPCVICFVKGVSTDRLIGFEGIGYKPDTFTLPELEARLLRAKVLVRAKMYDDDEEYQRNRNKNIQEDEDSGDDWD